MNMAERRPSRMEAQPVFGGELDLAIDHINQGVLLTGPSGSGKTVLGTAITTLGLSSVGIEVPAQENLVPDFALAGYSLKRDAFLAEIEDDIGYKLDMYLERYQGLPPIVMVDEVTPEYAAFLNTIPPMMRRQYESRNTADPRIVWVLQGDEQTQREMLKKASFLSGSFQIANQPKTRDPRVNNAGYRSAVGQASFLRKQLGDERFYGLVQKIQNNLSLR